MPRTAVLHWFLFLLGATCPGLIASGKASAACPALPYTVVNGQVADASKVMADLNSLKTCAESALAPSGTPTVGGLAKFATSGSLTTGNLSGDVTTSGALATTLSSTGVAPGSYICTNATFDAKGRATAAANGPCGGGGGAIPTIVQSAGVRGTSNGQSSFTATLPTAPTTGNLLLAILSGFSGASFTCPTGFGSLYTSPDIVSYQRILVCARVAQSGDSPSVTGTAGSPNGGATFLVAEFSGARGAVATSTSGYFTNSSLPFFGAPATGTSVTIGVVEYDGIGGAYSSISNGTLLFDGTDSSGGTLNHPSVFFKIAGLSNVVINFASAGTNPVLILLISVTS